MRNIFANYPVRQQTFEESNPWVSAVNAVDKMNADQLANVGASQTNQYRPGILQNQVLQGQLTNQKSQAEQPYWGANAQANLQSTQLANQHQQFVNQNPMLQQGGVTGELAAIKYYNQTGDKAGAQKLRDYVNSEIAYKQNGGYGAGVDIKLLNGLKTQIQRENPSLDQTKVDQISSAYLNGDDKLPDGTPVPPISGNSQQLLDVMGKKSTYAASANRNIKGMQAEAEIPILTAAVNEAVNLGGQRYLGYSPDALVAAFGSDDASQEKLGKIIGGRQLEYELAQQRNGLAGALSSVAATEELMNNSASLIQQKYPTLSPKAITSASNFVNETLRRGLKARLSVSIRGHNAATGGRNSKGVIGNNVNSSNGMDNNDPLGIR